MSNINSVITAVHAPLANLPVRILAFVMAVVTTGFVMWNPHQFADAIGGFGPVIAPAMIWSTCACMIHAMGFVPHKWYWKLLFTPVIALPVLAYILGLRLHLIM
ncbi:cyd operon protein YbgE [Photobacterium damselae]